MYYTRVSRSQQSKKSLAFLEFSEGEGNGGMDKREGRKEGWPAALLNLALTANFVGGHLATVTPAVPTRLAFFPHESLPPFTLDLLNPSSCNLSWVLLLCCV
ncbi:hypothetical protein DAI22_07g200250 [Oryza sativa Japonica Group]|nr:hypothetical protein DAI22_07g200250 [Oryza sativa Japonica Group]